MEEFFKAIRNLKDIPTKKHTVVVDGRTVEVDLETKKKVIQNGEQAYEWKDGKIVLKPKPTKPKVSYRTLKRDKYGYEFYDSDPHWPGQVVEGGYTWQTESE